MNKSIYHLVGFTIFALGVSAQADSAVKACQLLNSSFPQLVSFPGSTQYETDIEQWAFTSSQNATCTIEPASADDVSTIMTIIGRKDIRAPFAVKSGGHAYNKNFSSTTGVQISMAKFTGVSVDSTQGTATAGSGLTGDKVFSQLEPFGVMVAGGRYVGVGAIGLSLGGGYGWKTNQFGLTIDTIVSYNLVLPSGEQVLVTNTSDPDLFFGLKGGLNNFGIVTNITYETHPQGRVFGGVIQYDSNVTDSLNAAMSNFSLNNTDPKAEMLATYSYEAGQLTTAVSLFYDGPSPPAGIFYEFLAIPNISSQVQTGTFVEFINIIGTARDFGTDEFGLAATTVPITTYLLTLLNKMVEEMEAVGDKLTAANNGSTIIVRMLVEPFLNPLSHSRGGAYPHPPSCQVTPSSPLIVYRINSNLTTEAQEAFYNAIVSAEKDFANTIQAEAHREKVQKLILEYNGVKYVKKVKKVKWHITNLEFI